MSILNFAETAAAAANRGNTRTPFSGQTNPSDQPKAKVWLNVGFEKNGKFINLPFGLPIDTMKTADVRGQNEDWVKQQIARNELLKMLQDAGASFTPGQEETVNLTIKLRRVNEDLAVAPDTNEYSFNAADVFAKPAEKLEAAE